MDIAIVGAGIAGLACGELLRDAGHRVRLFDKGRGAGGRMATRRIETPLGVAAFDHGAQYYTVRDADFTSQAELWLASGVAAPWPVAGPDAWVGVPAMSTVVRTMAESLDVAFGVTVTGAQRSGSHWMVSHHGGSEGPFDALVFAIPAEQAAVLLSLHDFGMAQIALRARSQPCWTAMFAFAEPLAVPDSAIRDAGLISWAVRNSAKPGRQGPDSWVVQAQPEWSRDWLEESADKVETALLGALGEALGLASLSPIAGAAHRWRYAMSSATGDAALWCADKAIGACGDWLIAPRVESAWLSGRELAKRIVQSDSLGASPERLAATRA